MYWVQASIKASGFWKKQTRQARIQSSTSIRAMNLHFVQCNHHFISNKAIKKWITCEHYFQYMSSEILSQWTNIKAKCDNWALFQPSLFEVVVFTKRTSDSHSPSLEPVPTARSVQWDKEKYSSLLQLQFWTKGDSSSLVPKCHKPIEILGDLLQSNIISFLSIIWYDTLNLLWKKENQGNR